MTMKITRFAQSCILIETTGKRILIDPGYLQYKESYPGNEWNNIDILLVTHKHGDHCHIDAINKITKNPKTKFYTTKEVAEAYPELSPNLVKVDDILTFDNLKIEVVKAVHGYIPLLKGGKEIRSKLWLEEIDVEDLGDSAIVGAIWFFKRSNTENPQTGPVTIVYERTTDGWRIAHANFGNYK